MALYSVKPLYSASATVTNGSDIVQVTGNVNCSFLQSGAIVSISGSNRLVDAVSGTGIDGSGNSTIKLRRPWPGATITGQMLVFMSYEGLADAVFQLKSLIDAAAAEVEGAFSFKGDYDLATAGTLPINPAEGAGSEMWRISTSATVGGVLYRAGDLIFYDQYLTVWRKICENLGTAAYLNKGNGTNDVPDNAQLNARLGTSGNLGTAAQRPVMTSLTDTITANALMPRGAFGVGALGSAPAITNFNSYQPSGFYSAGSDVVSRPDPEGWGSYVLCLGSGVADRAAYLVMRSGSAAIRAWLSKREAGTLTTTELYHLKNIIGTVSQSGGVPTGAIVESGSNAIGSYVRYADGTQICHKRVNFSGVTINPANGSNLSTSQALDLTSAAAFVGTPTITVGRFGLADSTNSPIYTSLLSDSTGYALLNTGNRPANVWPSWITTGSFVATQGFYEMIHIGRWY